MFGGAALLSKTGGQSGTHWSVSKYEKFVRKSVENVMGVGGSAVTHRHITECIATEPEDVSVLIDAVVTTQCECA